MMDHIAGPDQLTAAPFVSRRTFAATLGAAVLGSALGVRAAAQPPGPRPPTVDTSNLKEIADGVWVVGDHRTVLVPNIGIVVGREAALVVDTGLGPANGERVFALARRLAGRRRMMLTMTHFHPEHGYGAQAFQPDATIVYNRVQRDELQQKGQFYIDLFRRMQGKAVADALDGTRLVTPHRVYDGPRTEIDLGGRTVELHATGAAHTRGDQVVFLPRERILFAGDLIEERMFPIFPWFPPQDADIDGARWMSVLRGFSRFDPAVIVPGHGDPGGMSIALALASQMEVVDRGVRTRRARGQTAAEILAAYKPEIVAAYPTWENPQYIDWQLNYLLSRSA